ncbi:hypothetical protein [Pedobacter xixiisoli]|nr:hypothetical protein [Pedobacter xixiisoli]
MEKQGKLTAALVQYARVTNSDPLHTDAWHRQMVILRKLKKPEKELELLGKAITAYMEANIEAQRDWMENNQEKIDSSRALAQALGLLDGDGLPIPDQGPTQQWALRKSLLSTRLQKSKALPSKKKAPQKSGKKS